MVSWKSINDDVRKKEKRSIFLIIMIFCIGVFVEFVPYFNTIRVVNYDSLSLVIIQLQSSLFTLTIALIALLAGRITDQYLGVRLNNFWFNIKPQYLKQKTIVAISLMFLVVNICFYMLQYYDIVVSIFCGSCILVWVSVCQIYNAFTGKENIEDEIRTYILELNDSHKGELRIFVELCSQWKKIITNQDTTTFNEYYSVFMFLFSRLIQVDGIREKLMSECSELVKLLIQDKESFGRGIKFTKECYDETWNYIKSNCNTDDAYDSLEKQKTPFNLFVLIKEKLVDSISDIDIKSVERVLHWRDFALRIIVVDSVLAFSRQKETGFREVNSIADFGGYLGYYISSGFNRVNVVDRNEKVWGSALNEMFITKFFPKTRISKEFCDGIIAEMNFRFLYSQLLYDERNMIIECLYKRIMNSHYVIEQPYIFMILKFHCYLYYISEHETSDCVNSVLRERARSILEDKLVIQAFHKFIDDVCVSDKNIVGSNEAKYDVFSHSLIEKMIKELRPFERYPDLGAGFKICVLDTAVEQFFTLLTMYLLNENNSPEIIDKIIGAERSADVYIRYIRDMDQRPALKRFLLLVGVSEDKIDTRSESAYSVFENRIKYLYKVNSIHEAEVRERINDDELIDEKALLAGKIKSYFEEQFSGLIDNSIDCKSEKVKVLNYRIPSNFKIVRIINDNYQNLFHWFVSFLASKLVSEHKIQVIDRRSFGTDENLLDYIKNNEDKMILGSESMLLPKDFFRREEFKEAIYNAEHYTDGAYGIVLFLNKNSVKINIQKVRVGIHSTMIKEVDTEYNKETGMYEYEVSQGMPTGFTEEELVKYLRDTSRTVNIVMHVQIQTNSGLLGMCIEKRDL